MLLPAVAAVRVVAVVLVKVGDAVVRVADAAPARVGAAHVRADAVPVKVGAARARAEEARVKADGVKAGRGPRQGGQPPCDPPK